MRFRWGGLSSRRSGRVEDNALYLLADDNAEQNAVQLQESSSELLGDKLFHRNCIDPARVRATPEEMAEENRSRCRDIQRLDRAGAGNMDRLFTGRRECPAPDPVLRCRGPEPVVSCRAVGAWRLKSGVRPREQRNQSPCKTAAVRE